MYREDRTVVTKNVHTSPFFFLSLNIFLLNFSLSICVPWYSMTGICGRVVCQGQGEGRGVTLTSGVNFLNSDTQLGRVERGAATRNGPFTCISIRWAITPITCRVFPRPISSARIPFTPFSYNTCRHQNDATRQLEHNHNDFHSCYRNMVAMGTHPPWSTPFLPPGTTSWPRQSWASAGLAV